MFGNSQMMGMDMGFPDVCLTPTPAGPVPIPYPNIGMGPTAIPGQVKVMGSPKLRRVGSRRRAPSGTGILGRVCGPLPAVWTRRRAVRSVGRSTRLTP